MGKRSREKKERRKIEQEFGKANGIATNLEKIYLWSIEGLVYLSFFTPLFVSAKFFFPYVSPKTFFFRIVVDLIAIAYVLLIVSNRKYLPRLNALTVSLLVFMVVITVTSITGVNLEKSFWSTFERMGGLLTFFHLFLYFLILTSVFRERKYWERFLTVSIFIGLLLAFYIYTSKDPTARGGGTIGNTSFVSAYLIFDVFFALILFLSKSGFWRVFYGLMFIPLVFLLLFPPQEPTRGAIGAFFGGIFLLAFGSVLYFVYTSKNQLAKKLIPVFLVLIILVGVGLSQTSFIKDKVQGFANSNSWQARAVVWKMGLVAWQERPLLGWGQDNFNVPFVKYFDSSLPLTVDVWYDRVHNIVFDVLVTAGILGLLSYLAIFLVATVGLLRLCPRIVDKKNVFIPLGMISLLGAYFAQNIWVFDMISSYMMFFFSLAFISFLLSNKKPEPVVEEEHKLKGLSPFVAAPFVVILIFTLFYGNVQPARASLYIIKGISSPLDQGITYFQKALLVSPMAIVEAPEQFSRIVSSLVFEEKIDRNVLNRAFETAAEDMRITIKQSPQDFRPYLVLGRQYADFYLVSGDVKHLEESEKILNKAIELSPANQQGYWSLSQTRLSQNRNQEAIDLMKKAVDLEPRFGISYWYLAMTYRVAEDYQSALREIQAAKEHGYDWTSSGADIEKVIGIYQELQDDQVLVSLYVMGIEKAPKNARFRAGLAVSYANLGQFDKARQLANEAIELNPEFAKDMQDFINSLP